MPTKNVKRSVRRRRRPKRVQAGRNQLVPAMFGGVARDIFMSPGAPQRVVHHDFYGVQQVIAQGEFDTFFAYVHTLMDNSDMASFGGYFQQFRIEMVEAEFRPMYRANPIEFSPNGLIPQIYVAVDVNDNLAWSNIGQAHSYQNIVVNDDSKGFCVRYRPQVAVGMYASGVFTGYGHYDTQPWVDCRSSTTGFYGLKVAISGSGVAAAAQQWNLTFRYKVAYRFEKGLGP